MATQFRSAGARRARNEFVVLKALGVALLGLSGYAGLTVPAHGPAHGELASSAYAAPAATLAPRRLGGELDHVERERSGGGALVETVAPLPPPARKGKAGALHG